MSRFLVVLAALACLAASYTSSPMDAGLPDPVVTPGAHRVLSFKAICGTKWGKDDRHVTARMKNAVYASYGVAKVPGKCCEIDHLVPRDLGGADVMANLWPQSWAEARKKDRLEVKLHKLVCARELSLRKAQEQIAQDWAVLYFDVFGERP